MGYLKKSIVLANKYKGITYGIGVLNIEVNNGGVFGNFTSHDLNVDNYILGISVGGKEVVKLDIAFSGDNVFNFRLQPNFDINAEIGAVVVQIVDDNVVPIMWGANGNKASVRQDIISNIEDSYLSLDNQIEKTETSVQNLQHQMNLFEQDDKIDTIIENAVDDAMQELDNFYEQIKPQLEQLFDNYNHIEELENIIPYSQWVKVDFEGEGKEYVVGKIFDNDTLKYICYGVPGKYSVAPPENLAKYSQWLPLDSNGEDGYWIMYQDALTGEAQEVS